MGLRSRKTQLEKQTRKISKELHKEYMWLPYPAFESLPGTHMISKLGSEVSGKQKLFVSMFWDSLTGCIQPQKLHTEDIRRWTTVMQIKTAK